MDPIVLTWPDPNAPVPSGSPPSYNQARVPLTAINYTFSPHGQNTLLLLPPLDSPDTRPQFHISVSLNCMNPFSFITSVHRGASDSGPYVGEFEMGISTVPGTVCMGNTQKIIKEALRSQGDSKWTWRFKADPKQHIRWELPVNTARTGLYNCYMASDTNSASTDLKIAQYKGVPFPRAGERPGPCMLRVYPQAQEIPNIHPRALFSS